MIVIFFIDLEHLIIPDEIVYPVSVAVILWHGMNHQPLIINYLLSAIVVYLFFRIIIFLTRGRGMGMGDAKLGMLMGLILGFRLTVVSLYLAFLTGALVGVILILIGKKKFGQTIPFGPFLSASTIVVLFWGNILFTWFAARFF